MLHCGYFLLDLMQEMETGTPQRGNVLVKKKAKANSDKMM